MKTTTVRLAIPAGSANGDFAYLITTSGWPTGYNITDNGTRINAHVNPPSGLEPPVVTISSPDDGTNYTHTIGAPAIMVPITPTAMPRQSSRNRGQASENRRGDGGVCEGDDMVRRREADARRR